MFLFAQPANAAVIEQGDLIRCPDFTAVYYVSEDGSRWAYPNEKTFFTWWNNFDAVVWIECDELSTYPIGGVVTYQPGTRLLKLRSAPNVYAVEPGGVLRKIDSPSQALRIYGERWKNLIDDLSEGFWSTYTLGTPIQEAETPTGTIWRDVNTNFYHYVDGNCTRRIGQEFLTDIMQRYAHERPSSNHIETSGFSGDQWRNIRRQTLKGEQGQSVCDGLTDDLTFAERKTSISGPMVKVGSGSSYSLSWSEINEATTYELQEADSSSFENMTSAYSSSGLNKTFLKSISVNTNYYYRVRGRKGDEVTLWSDAFPVVLSPDVLRAPVLAGPSTAFSNQNYKLSWGDVPEADKYFLEESTSPNFSNVSVLHRYRTLRKWVRHTEVVRERYYYRVRAINDVSNSVWSNVHTVDVSPQQYVR